MDHASSEPIPPILPEPEALRREPPMAPPPAVPPPPPRPTHLDAFILTSSTAPAPGLHEFELPGAAPAPAKPGFTDKLKKMGPLGAGLAVLLGKLKILLPALKFLLPALKTGGSMLIYVWFLALGLGWPFAVGVVLCIFVHEMGHVFVSWRLGIPVSAPLFIPGMGAFILQKKWAKSMWEEALIGVGGPFAGMLAGLVCLGVGLAIASPLFLGIAYVTFMLNLFNMMPLFPMDGGRIAGAVSPRIWLVGLVAMGVLYWKGVIHNPFLIIIALMSLPCVWRGLKHGDIVPPGGIAVTSQQRVIMGITYVSLSGVLVWLMMLSAPHVR